MQITDNFFENIQRTETDHMDVLNVFKKFSGIYLLSKLLEFSIITENVYSSRLWIAYTIYS